MLATIWICTQEWSLICRRAIALTLETPERLELGVGIHALEEGARSFRLPLAGTRIRICSTACAGVMRASRSSPQAAARRR